MQKLHLVFKTTLPVNECVCERPLHQLFNVKQAKGQGHQVKKFGSDEKI